MMDVGYTILFLDASGFHLTPTVVHTWAPCGQTPILSAKLSRVKGGTHPHFSTFGGYKNWHN
jgi:hypothetical protein